MTRPTDPPENYHEFEGVFIAADAWQAWERGDISADALMLLHQLRTYESADGFTKSTNWLVENCGLANAPDPAKAVEQITGTLKWLADNKYITISGTGANRKIRSLRKIDNAY